MSCVIENFFYIISVSFQIAGALLLVLFSISTKRDSVIRRFVGNGIITKDGDSKILDYNENAYKEEYRRAFLNKYSFGCILLGYMLSIWGEIEDGSRLEYCSLELNYDFNVDWGVFFMGEFFQKV